MNAVVALELTLHLIESVGFNEIKRKENKSSNCAVIIL